MIQRTGTKSWTGCSKVRGTQHPDRHYIAQRSLAPAGAISTLWHTGSMVFTITRIYQLKCIAYHCNALSVQLVAQEAEVRCLLSLQLSTSCMTWAKV